MGKGRCCRIIANVSCSTLFIHGEADGLIPPEHSLRLFKKCRARKLLVTPPKMERKTRLKTADSTGFGRSKLGKWMKMAAK